MTIVAIAFFALLLAGLVLVIYGTAVKNKWGVNLDGSLCPRCRAAMPAIRGPEVNGAVVVGGSTCHNCGCEVDKWGREVSK
jgi:hypothetical protein